MPFPFSRISKNSFNLFLCASSLLLLAHTRLCAAETSPAHEQDLGQGLTYVRLADLAAELPALRAALAAQPALVIDVRSSTGNTEACQAFRDALTPDPAKPRQLRLILLNTQSAPALTTTLGVGLPNANIRDTLTITPSTSGIASDLIAACTHEDDQRACDAIAADAPLSSLLNHQPEKQRYDEALLAKEYTPLPEINRTHASPDAAAPATVSTEGKTAPAASEKMPPDATVPPKTAAQPQAAPLSDAVLQLAVHTHRALVALNRLPRAASE